MAEGARRTVEDLFEDLRGGRNVREQSSLLNQVKALDRARVPAERLLVDPHWQLYQEHLEWRIELKKKRLAMLEEMELSSADDSYAALLRQRVEKRALRLSIQELTELANLPKDLLARGEEAIRELTRKNDAG